MVRGFSRYLKFVPAALFVAAGFILPSAASATVYGGKTTDPKGDGPSPGRDITGASVDYDNKTGLIEFTVKLDAAPSGSLQLTTGLGRMSGGTCSVPLLLLGTFMPDGATLWLVERDGTTPAEEQDSATRTVSGSTVKLRAKDPRLIGFNPNCAETILSDPDDTSSVFDDVNTFAVKPPPRKPNLKLRVAGASPVKRGASRVISVRVRNAGKAPASKVRVRIRSRGPASIRPASRKVGRLAPGKSRTLKFRLKVRSGAKGKIGLDARASGKKTSARAKATMRVIVPKPPPPPTKGGLGGRIFWGFESYRFDRSSEIVFLHFVNSKFVRWGVPKGGLVRCGRVTAKVKDGEMQPGCLRYRYDPSNGKVRIGKVKGTFRGGELKLNMKADIWPTDGDAWYEGLTARPGARFNVKLINRGFYGACGITPYCTTWKENLNLTRDGRFGRQDSSLSTGGGIGTGLPFVAISQLGPNQKGRYKVLSGGRIRFDYASGKKVTETLIVQTDKKGRPDAAREGMLLDDTWFYKPDEDD